MKKFIVSFAYVFLLEKVITNPIINMATLMIRGVQFAELTAMSNPKKLKLSESSAACTPVMTAPIRPNMVRILPG